VLKRHVQWRPDLGLGEQVRAVAMRTLPGGADRVAHLRPRQQFKRRDDRRDLALWETPAASRLPARPAPMGAPIKAAAPAARAMLVVPG
jgi:hypothetical protein